MVPERFGTLRPDGRGAWRRTSCWCRCWRSTGAATGWATAPGYYDRTLAACRGGSGSACAYAAQELDEVPAGPYDARLDAVATERGVIFCKE